MSAKALPFTLSQLETIAAQVGTPFHLYDEPAMRANARAFYAAFSWVPGGFKNFFAVKAASILLGLVSIPALFYTLTGMFGKLPDWVNITIFFLADALLYFVSYRLLTDGALRGGAMQLIGFVLLWALLFAFVWFTYRPLHLPLFLGPVSGCYGLETPC